MTESEPAGAGARILLVSNDDDVAGPLADLLRRAGRDVEAVGTPAAIERLEGAAPDVLILDHDLPAPAYRALMDCLAAHHAAASFPLLILGGGPHPAAPLGWHEDAVLPLSRPPHPAEVLLALRTLDRLAFYRSYRILVHDLAQPVMTVHALSRTVARLPIADEAGRQSVDRLAREAERLMTLMETFQRERRKNR